MNNEEKTAVNGNLGQHAGNVNDETTEFEETERRDVGTSERTKPAGVVGCEETRPGRPPERKRGKRWVAAAAGAGILLGSVSAAMAGTGVDEVAAVSEGDAIMDADAVASADSHPLWTDGSVEIATSVDDDMTFDEAFAAAREEVGAGGAFEWHGNAYSTYTPDEWSDLSADQQDDYYSHITLGGEAAEAADEVIDIDIEAADDVTFDGPVDFATNVNDDMTFDEAFAAAREELGAGGAFEWHGNAYNTYYAEEWADMSADEQQDYLAHVDMNYDGGDDDLLDDIQLADDGDTGDFGDDVEVIGTISDEIAGDDIFIDVDDDGIPDMEVDLTVDYDDDDFSYSEFDDPDYGSDDDFPIGMDDDSAFMDDDGMSDYINNADVDDYDGFA